MVTHRLVGVRGPLPLHPGFPEGTYTHDSKHTHWGLQFMFWLLIRIHSRRCSEDQMAVLRMKSGLALSLSSTPLARLKYHQLHVPESLLFFRNGAGAV